MLTFILLVVLGGGVGLLVVSLAESSKPTAEEPPAQRAEPDPPPEPAWEPVAVEPDPEPTPEPLRRRRTSEPVPKSQIAVEGRFADVARVPLWRRLAAVVGIVTISVLTGVLIAAILAAAIGTAAELVNTAIG